MASTDTGAFRSPVPWAAVAAGLLHLAALPFYAASGLLAPGWAVLLLLAAWAVGAGLIVVLRRRGPLLLLVPLGAVALWFGLLTAGEQLLGWTA